MEAMEKTSLFSEITTEESATVSGGDGENMVYVSTGLGNATVQVYKSSNPPNSTLPKPPSREKLIRLPEIITPL